MPDVDAGSEEVTGLYAERFAPAVRFETKTAAFTPALDEANKVFIFNSASDAAVTIPPNADVAFPLGTTIQVVETGAGHATMTAGSGVTFEGTTVVTAAATPSITALKIDTNTWAVYR